MDEKCSACICPLTTSQPQKYKTPVSPYVFISHHTSRIYCPHCSPRGDFKHRFRGGRLTQWFTHCLGLHPISQCPSSNPSSIRHSSFLSTNMHSGLVEVLVMAQMLGNPASHMGTLNWVPTSSTGLPPDLAISGSWGVNQQIGDYPSVSVPSIFFF